MIMAVTAFSFSACSDDDDEISTKAIAGHGLDFYCFRDFKNGEVVNSGSCSDGNKFYYLNENGTLGWDNSSNSTWKISGNSIIITYDTGDEESLVEKWAIENIYAWGGIVLRKDFDDNSDYDFRRVYGIIDSDDFDDVESPDWWEELISDY